MSIVFGIDSSVLILAAVVIIVILIAAFLIVRKFRAGTRNKYYEITLNHSLAPLRVKKIPVGTPENSSDNDTDFTSAPRRKERDCLEGMADISQSLEALAEKYSLTEITLATSDGLLLASSQKQASADTIARYCGMYTSNSRPWPPGIVLFGIEHKGSFLVGIAKTKDPLLQEPDQELVRETKDILNWWI